MLRRRFYTLLLILLPIVVWANPVFIEGKDYALIPLAESVAQGDKVQVVEFFSFACPWCYRLEPAIEKWLKTKPKYVEFKRVPVVFEHGWDIYAKAYYTADSLNIAEKITPKLFDAIQTQKRDLSTQDKMATFFAEHGVDKEAFESAFRFSPSIDMHINHGKQLMRQYQVFSVPTIVIAGKYKTSPRMADGDNQRFIEILNYLVKKARS